MQRLETDKQSVTWRGMGKLNSFMLIMSLLWWLCITLVIKSLTGILTVLRWIFPPNLDILPWLEGDSSRGQAQTRVKFYFWIKLTLKVNLNNPIKQQGYYSRFGTPLIKIWLSQTWKGDRSLRRQTHDYRPHRPTHKQTDAGKDNTPRPKVASG